MAEVKGMRIEFSADTSKLEQGLKKTTSSLKSTEKELKAVERGLRFNPGNTTLLKQKFDLLKRSVDQTGDKLRQLKEKQKAMDNAGVDKTSKQYRELEREIIKTQNQLDRAKQELKQFGSVGIQKARAVGAAFKKAGAKMTAFGKTMTTRVTAPIAAAGAVSVKKFAEVDKTMQLTNSTMANTAEEATLLNDAMKSAAAASTFGMNDAATATLNFARAGLSAKQAADALSPAMALAAGEGGNLETVSAGLVATVNGFHGEFSEAGKYADVFANACNNSALDVNSLSEAMSVAAPIFASAGYSVQDASLFLGIMANNGIEASKAANSLKTGLARLISPAKQGEAKMEELGISITNADGSMKDSVQIQKELHDAFGKLSESEQIAAASAIFGKNQMAPWLALINTAPDDVTSLNTALEKSGTAMEMQASMMGGFGGSLEKLKSGVDVLAYSFGEALAPMVSKVAAVIQKLVDWFNGLSPQMQSIIAVIAVIVAAIGPLLVILGVLLSSIGTIITVATTIGPIIGGAFAAAAVPVAPLVLAIGGAIAVGILLYKNWDKVKAFMVRAVTTIKTKFTSAFNAIKQNLTKWKANVTAIFNGVRDKLKSVQQSMSNFKSRVASIFSGVKDAITKPINTAKDAISKFVSKVKGMFNGIKIKFPHVPYPHFDIEPKGWKLGDLAKGKIPKLTVSTYANAMQSGRILSGATMFGEKNGRILQGGEVGRELIIGANSAAGLISGAVARGINSAAGILSRAVGTQTALASAGPQDLVVNVYLYKNGPQMGREIVKVYDTWKAKLG